MEPNHKKDARPAGRFWVLQQHDQVKVMAGGNRPDTAPVAGERRRRAFGPYASAEIAEAKAQQLRRGHTSHGRTSRRG